MYKTYEIFNFEIALETSKNAFRIKLGRFDLDIVWNRSKWAHTKLRPLCITGHGKCVKNYEFTIRGHEVILSFSWGQISYANAAA